MYNPPRHPPPGLYIVVARCNGLLQRATVMATGEASARIKGARVLSEKNNNTVIQPFEVRIVSS